ncbi:hypothetical protein CIPAW_01G263100 [Carya illinoinensis]|uniref:Uncharacterized protein n=1 Tax=Carya illinoinensis TaxID=32201 RepID=A0A8T1RSX1_CARIL|nr:hypothetical protein CIPAW_01G263100 [Carya illinoinensis]KAG6734262.1 hypothetical protein I3842_01G264900 [Carya illinoinensis]
MYCKAVNYFWMGFSFREQNSLGSFIVPCLRVFASVNTRLDACFGFLWSDG